MSRSKNSSTILIRKLCLTAMLTALSVVIGIICKNFLTWSVYYRVTFENLPIIITGYFLGPVWGMCAGVAADVVSCLCSSNPAVNYIIMIGAAMVGLLSGLMRLVLKKSPVKVSLAMSVSFAHLIGQVIIKSIGKIIYFGMPWFGIFLGLVISIGVGTLEYLFIRLLIKNPSINKQLKELSFI